MIGSVQAPILLLRSAQPRRGPVHVVLEPYDDTNKLLAAALAMAGGHGESSVITGWQPEPVPEKHARDLLPWAAPELRMRSFSSPTDLERLIVSVAGGTLVLSATSSLLELQTWWHQFARARCALLLVR